MSPLPPQLDPVVSLLNRSDAQRAREQRMRFAQSMVFGLPVVALEVWGRRLGGAEAGRWVWLMQLLLAGWVMYVGAAAMVIEAILRRALTLDCLFSLLALAAYAMGIARVAHGFAIAVSILCLWALLQWLRLARRV